MYGELIDAQIMQRKDGKLEWKYNQIREAVFEDTGEGHCLAFKYCEKRFAKTNSVQDKVNMLYHQAKFEYKSEIFEQFVALPELIKEEDWVNVKLLPELGEELKKHVAGEYNGIACGTLGNIYWKISNYKDKAENCKKAIKAYEEALKVYTFARFPIQYAMTQNNLGTAYRTLAEVEDKAENCKLEKIKAIWEIIYIAYNLRKLTRLAYG